MGLHTFIGHYRIENGHADVQLSTLFRIFAGLGKRVSLSVS